MKTNTMKSRKMPKSKRKQLDGLGAKAKGNRHSETSYYNHPRKDFHKST
jgi:adenylate cyclase class IV